MKPGLVVRLGVLVGRLELVLLLGVLGLELRPPRGRCRSRSDPRPGAGSPRSARSASRRARRSGACAARCRRRSRAASRRARARARAGGRSGPSSPATACGGRPRSRRAPRRARRDGPSRGPAPRPDLRRGGGRARLPIPARGARRRSARPARPTCVSGSVSLLTSAQHEDGGAAFLRSGAPVLVPGSGRAALDAAYPILRPAVRPILALVADWSRAAGSGPSSGTRTARRGFRTIPTRASGS